MVMTNMNTPVLDGLKIVANLMTVSACTAPKAGGVDWIQSKLATDKEKHNISMNNASDRRIKRKRHFQIK